MDDDITLKRCPFCGSYPIHEDIGGINYYRYHIFCGKCGAAMPYEHIDEIAISRWNSRVKMEGENTMNKKELENEIPEELTFEVGDKYDYVDSDGGICWTCYTHTSLDDIDRVRHHRAFRTERLARIFADKTQFIADLTYLAAYNMYENIKQAVLAAEDSEAGEWEKLEEDMGEWIDVYKNDMFGRVCSKCGTGVWISKSIALIIPKYKYCPFCGREMKVRKNDEINNKTLS